MATEPVKEKPEATATEPEAPKLLEAPPVETKPVETVAEAREAVPRLIEPTVTVIEPEIAPTVVDEPGPGDDATTTEIPNGDIPILIPVGTESIEPETGPTTSRVTVVKLTCPEDVVRSDDDDYLLSEQCREDAGPVEFMVSGSAGYVDSAYTRLGVPHTRGPYKKPRGSARVPWTVPRPR